MRVLRIGLMVRPLAHITNWIFDLDNTLYPASNNLFGLIDEKMGRYIAKLLGCDLVEARRVQKLYFHDHGTTLAGLMKNEGVDPHGFLDYVHDIDLSRLQPAPALRRSISALPGDKYIFTNADRDYADRVVDKLGLKDLFSGIHDIHACNYEPKPEINAYKSMVTAFGIIPEQSVFFEDMARNLAPAKKLGMRTIWINNGSEWGENGAHSDFIDFETGDLAQWLATANTYIYKKDRHDRPH